MEFKNILVEIKDKVGIIKMNRPNAMNALNTETLQELSEAISGLNESGQVRVIIITGEGKAFVAGADIAEMKDMSRDEAQAFSQKGQNVFDLIAKSEKPVIAAVNGFALGGGCELALACDIRIASDKAKLGQPEVNLGVIPGFAGTQRLSRLVGAAKAKEMIFTGDMIDAQTAHSIGLVNQVVPVDQLMNVCMELANKIASKGPTAIKLAKQVIDEGIGATFEVGSAREGRERNGFAECFASGEAKEGMTAFLEKKKPNWS
ncbi:MAG: enoyl-CoA hydratase/isomerase family protein [candidate division Zixibacteria bacterium]|nr:enoyl-CoA hydratase/isomerase family protein [candidate division Zixibacteria bacterium]